MRVKGKITSWNDDKGYGFIVPNDGGKQVFVHINAFGNRNRRPEVNQVVTYALSNDKQGRPCAVTATLAGDCLQQKKKQGSGSLSVIAAMVFLTIVAVSVVASKLHPAIFAIYLAVSSMTFIMYARDKSAAREGAWRTKESTLHLLALAGGWPGALIAQQKLRHKSKKESFLAVFWITVLLNCAIFIWLHTSQGTKTFQSFVEALM
jgi:uncharacterized membrane protein YsdA (DUF1294 family)/cold shock CspA family protein